MVEPTTPFDEEEMYLRAYFVSFRMDDRDITNKQASISDRELIKETNQPLVDTGRSNDVHALDVTKDGKEKGISIEGVYVGIILGKIKENFDENRLAKYVLQSRNVLKQTIFFFHSLKKNPIEMDILRELLNSALSKWRPERIMLLNEVSIPDYVIRDYEKTVCITGFGNAVRNMIRNKNINLADKIILILGWRQTCKLKDNDGCLELEQPGKHRTKDVLYALKNIQDGLTPSSTGTETNHVLLLNEAIPWAEEITNYPFLKFLNDTMVDIDAEKKRAKLALFTGLLSNRVPEYLLFDNLDDKNKLINALRHVSVLETGEVKIESEAQIVLFHTKCNVGVIGLMYEQSNLIDDCGIIYTGSLFQHILKYREKICFNQSVIDGLMNELYIVIDSYFRRKNYDVGINSGAYSCLCALKTIKSFIDTSREKLTDKLHMEFNHGCVILNNHIDILTLGEKDIPVVIMDYLGDGIDNAKPPTPVIQAQDQLNLVRDKTFSDFAGEFYSHVYQVNIASFRTMSSTNFDGMSSDKYVFERYCKENIFAMPYCVNKTFLELMLNNIDNRGAGLILAGGMACMLRFNNGSNRMLERCCKDFMHSFSSELTNGQKKEFKMQGEGAQNEKRIASVKEIIRRKAYGVLFDSQSAYSALFGRDKRFQPNIDFVFKILRTGRVLIAWQLLCSIDVFFAETLILFGLAVFFRGCVESKQYQNHRVRAFGSLISDESMRAYAISNANTIWGDESIRISYWHILSVIIHAWDSDERRFANKSNLKKFMPIFRWEILYLFFNVMYKVQSPGKQIELGINAGDQPAITLTSHLKSINSILDKLIKLTIE